MVTRKKKKSHYLSPAQAEVFNKPLLSAILIVTLQPAKDLAKHVQRRERSLVTTSSLVHLPSVRLSWLYLYKGGTGSFYLGVVT